MKVCVLSSGSQGNMTYIETKKYKYLIDAGISISNASSRNNNINFQEVSDLFITHEHIDHIKFLDTVVKKTNSKLYISKKSFGALKDEMKDKLVGRKICFIEENSRYKINNDIYLYTIPLMHDCAEIFGFIIEEIETGKRIGYFTDTGVFPSKFKPLIKTLDLLIIEANHNVEMLQNSNRGYSLIYRILSPNGHMSNQACYELLSEELTDRTKITVLAHVSQDCNCDKCLHEEIIDKLDNKYKIIIARQKEATDVFEV